MTLYELNLYLDNSYISNIISACYNTVSCLYRTPYDEQLSRSKAQDAHPQSGTLNNITLHNKTCCHNTLFIQRK